MHAVSDNAFDLSARHERRGDGLCAQEETPEQVLQEFKPLLSGMLGITDEDWTALSQEASRDFLQERRHGFAAAAAAATAALRRRAAMAEDSVANYVRLLRLRIRANVW